MRKEGIVGGFLLLTAIVLLLRFSPQGLALIIISIMCAVVVFGYFAGFMKMMNFSRGFVNARVKIQRARDVQTDSPWIVILEEERIFFNDTLDQEFSTYKEKAAKLLKENNTIVEPIEELMDEDFLALHTWNSLLAQIPSTMTGLGILGTFLGLVIGMDGMGFSSVTSAVGSISTLLSGIQIAFYTSIAGVILSILFNLIYHIIWEMMIQERGLFIQDFHQYIIPKTEEQIRQNSLYYQHELIERLDLISGKLEQITDYIENSKNEDVK